MRSTLIMTVSLVIAILLASPPLAYLTTAGELPQILAHRSDKYVQDTVGSPSGADKELLVPACRFDSSLMDRGSKSEKPLQGGRPSPSKIESGNPPIHYEVGSMECQA